MNRKIITKWLELVDTRVVGAPRDVSFAMKSAFDQECHLPWSSVCTIIYRKSNESDILEIKIQIKRI